VAQALNEADVLSVTQPCNTIEVSYRADWSQPSMNLMIL